MLCARGGFTVLADFPMDAERFSSGPALQLARAAARRIFVLRAVRLGCKGRAVAPFRSRCAFRARAMLKVLNVAFPLAPVGPNAVGGAEQVLSMLDRALVDRGHES